jgi:hypothetical protein
MLNEVELAKNRYGWQKRAKEMARKEKKNEKIKRRQGKTTSSLAEEMPVMDEEGIKVPNGIDLPAEDLS